MTFQQPPAPTDCTYGDKAIKLTFNFTENSNNRAIARSPNFELAALILPSFDTRPPGALSTAISEEFIKHEILKNSIGSAV
jgi:hypothetical protein